MAVDCVAEHMAESFTAIEGKALSDQLVTDSLLCRFSTW